jgi:hypothetical protein
MKEVRTMHRARIEGDVDGAWADCELLGESRANDRQMLTLVTRHVGRAWHSDGVAVGSVLAVAARIDALPLEVTKRGVRQPVTVFHCKSGSSVSDQRFESLGRGSIVID